MFILESILSFLLKHQGGTCIPFARIFGYFLLFVGGGIGLYFLFQALIPLIGYLESGAALSALLLGAGLFFLFWERRKKATCPLDIVLEEAQNILKKTDVEKVLKNNVYKVILFSFMGGLILSQCRDGKRLAFLKDKLLQYKDFLK